MIPIGRPILLLWLATQVSGFVAFPRRGTHVTFVPLQSSNKPDDGSIEAMRRLLEGSWNTETMGKLPATPEDAANEAGGSLLTARERGHNLMLINLLLPSYDITMGSNLYNEVDAVNFCLLLSQFLEGKASIVVRDSKTVKTVSRVLEAREAAAAAAEQSVYQRKKEVINSDDGEEDEDDEDDEELGDAQSKEQDMEDQEDSVINMDDAKKAELNDFRQQLMAGWGGDIEEPESTADADVKETLPQSMQPDEPVATNVDLYTPVPDDKSYRLTSMFGDDTFKKGPDMFEAVIKAVSVNAQPREDEDTLIILSAASQEETIGVRALVAKYQQSKTILLVNCQFDPVPKELLTAETIYYLLPLIAKAKEGESSLTESKGSLAKPKVVVLRRYPREFEVYMDFGKGMELTETASVREVGRTGPSLAWVAERVKKQMDIRSF
jgi:Domain of unknown function (DUF1995)